jgi:hypothetical protein
MTFMYLPGGRDWRARCGVLEHTGAWLASRPGITERA